MSLAAFRLLRSLVGYDTLIPPGRPLREALAAVESLPPETWQPGTGLSRVRDLVLDRARTLDHAPDMQVLRSHLEQVRDGEGVDALEVMWTTARPLKGGDLQALVAQVQEEWRRTGLASALREAAGLLAEGGSAACWEHLAALRPESVDPRSSGVLASDMDLDITADERIGVLSGIIPLDEVVSGLLPGQLWVHAAYTSQLKSTLALNWALAGAVYERDTLYLSMEMGEQELLRVLLTIWSAYQDAGPLTLREVSSPATLPPARRARLEEEIRSFRAGPGRHIRVSAIAPEQPEIDLARIRAMARSADHLDMVVVDHGELVSSQGSDDDPVGRKNLIPLGLKRMAVTEGVGVLLLWQISRSGYASARKNLEKGRSLPAYELSALSYAHEAERSADVVTTGYLGPPLDPDILRIEMLKRRAGRRTDPMEIRVDMDTMRLAQRPAWTEVVQDEVPADALLEGL